MLLRVPRYYGDFRCKADRCTDSCCIGWEIDIDKKSLERYEAVGGSFGNKLRKNISKQGTPHFILGENRRCPFLNGKNLCEMYIALGEESLCNICTDHPRYFEWFNRVKEGGVGMCCEAAAELILTSRENFSFCEMEVPEEEGCDCDEEFFSYLFTVRAKIIDFFQRREISLKDRLCSVVEYALRLQEKYDRFEFDIPDIERKSCCGDPAKNREFLSFFAGLESMEQSELFGGAFSDYPDIVKASTEFFEEFPEAYGYLEKAAVYFVWRHLLKSVFEGEFYSKVAFSVLSTCVTGILFVYSYMETGIFNIESAVRCCVYYSKEIEYSEENLNQIFDAFYDNDNFSVEEIKKILNIF